MAIIANPNDQTVMFDNIPFFILTQDGTLPIPMPELQINERHIPYSNDNVIDIGGLNSPKLQVSIFVFPPNPALLIARYGQTKLLVYRGATAQATLATLGNRRRAATADRREYFDATFIVHAIINPTL